MTHAALVGAGGMGGRGRRDPSAPRPPLRERLAALRLVPRLLRLVWETHPAYTGTMIVLRLVRSVVPVTSLWVAKLIIDEVIGLARTGGSIRHLWSLVLLEMATVVGGELLARLSGLIEGLLSDLFTNRISIRIMEHAASLDLHMFEDPAFYDHLERARQGTTGRVALLSQLLGIGQSTLTLASLSVALAAQAPWLLVLLAVVHDQTALPSAARAGSKSSSSGGYSPRIARATRSPHARPSALPWPE